jgi:hypothetical protein
MQGLVPLLKFFLKKISYIFISKFFSAHSPGSHFKNSASPKISPASTEKKKY